MEGLRASIAVVTLVALAVWFRKPMLSWAALGAFWTCLADSGGSATRRIACMVGFSLAGTITAFVAAVAGAAGPVIGGGALLTLAFLTSLSGTYGPAAAQVGTLAAVVAVVAVAFPQAPVGAALQSGTFLLGTFAAMALCLLLPDRGHPMRHAGVAGVSGVRRRLLRPVPGAILQHATRLALAVAAAYALAAALGLKFPYWVTLSTVVVVQPAVGATWPRSLERMLGSTVGGLIAAALVHLAPTPLALLPAVLPVTLATIALRRVSYTLFAVAVTCLFVLVTELLMPTTGIPITRAINSVLGSAIGAAAALVPWPKRAASLPRLHLSTRHPDPARGADLKPSRRGWVLSKEQET